MNSFSKEKAVLSAALNDSGDMTLLRDNNVIRYHSHASKHELTLSLATHLFKYSAEKTAMFANSNIPATVPFVRANINICDILNLQAQLPGIGAFGEADSDTVLGVTFTVLNVCAMRWVLMLGYLN